MGLPTSGTRRDRAIIATLAYTACRAGAVARLRLGDFQPDGTQFVLRFREKGDKSRAIPVRHDLEGYIRAYLDAAGLGQGAKDSPLYRASNGRHGVLSERPIDTTAVGELVKRGDHQPLAAQGGGAARASVAA